MDCAAAMGNSELVTLLINFEADVDPTDKNKVCIEILYIYTFLVAILIPSRDSTVRKRDST